MRAVWVAIISLRRVSPRSLCRFKIHDRYANISSRLTTIRDEFETPEDINDSPVTAPSKRVENLLPGYEKPLFGNLAVLEIGLTKIRAEYPHFANWLTKLESLVIVGI